MADRTTKVILWGCAGLVMVVVAIPLLALAFGPPVVYPESTPSGPPVAEYYVSGSAGARSASVTYEAAPGATEQRDVQLPWTYRVREYKPGMYLYISGRNASDEGCVDVRIFINEKSIKDARGCGRYSSASVKGSFR